MKTCPMFFNRPCKRDGCEWWIHHDGIYGCAVTKILPELFESRKWLSIIARHMVERVNPGWHDVSEFYLDDEGG